MTIDALSPEEKKNVIGILRALSTGHFDESQLQVFPQALKEDLEDLSQHGRHLDKLQSIIDHLSSQVEAILEGKEIAEKIEWSQYALMHDAVYVMAQLETFGMKQEASSFEVCRKIVNYVEPEKVKYSPGFFSQETISPYYESMKVKLDQFVTPPSLENTLALGRKNVL